MLENIYTVVNNFSNMENINYIKRYSLFDIYLENTVIIKNKYYDVYI